MVPEPLDYARIYEYRFNKINPEAKKAVWKEISQWIFKSLGSPQIILDPAAGSLEFLESVPAAEKWAVDLRTPQADTMASNLRFIKGNIWDIDLPENYFEGIFISNFLEHLNSVEEVNQILVKLRRSLKEGRSIAIMGPNYKFCSREYFDCADHRLILTHTSVEEHLFAAQFHLEKVYSKFLPYSFRSNLPASPLLTRIYLNLPLAWKFLGKQFLVIAKKPNSSESILSRGESK